jgi:transposase
VNRRPAEALLAELGVDMRPFPRDRPRASWAALCPGNHTSAGKHQSGKTRKGNRWLRTTLIEAALAAVTTKGSPLAARSRRILRRRGHKKAVVAVAPAILRTADQLLSRGITYPDLGADYFDRRRAIALLDRQGS